MFVPRMSAEYRMKFASDIVLDIVCYRKHGHNEADEPAFTQPLMYEKIRDRPTVRALYTEALIKAGELSQDEADTIAETFRDKMQAVYDEVHGHHNNGD